MNSNPLARDFNMLALLKYTLPSVFMMVFMSTYTIVDGVFVANLVSEDALSAVNLIYPLFGVVMALGLMFATGGNAIIARLMGEGRNQEARQFLSVIFIIGTAIGAVLTIFVYAFPNLLLSFLGVSESLYSLSSDYLLSLAGFAIPIFYLVFVQSFLVTAGKPTLGLIICIAGGITNMVLDYFLISPDFMDLGIAGAGLATGIGNSLPGIFGLVYFFVKRKGDLYFVKPKWNGLFILKSMYNGLSELIGSLAISITTIMFNTILLSIAGESGVAAISVILYIQQFQTAIYFGFTLGVAPIISYKFGEKNNLGLSKVIRKSLIFNGVVSVLVIALTFIFANEAVAIFISRESQTFAMAKEGLLVFLPAYICMGLNIFFSAMFTALSNGKASAIISISRSLVFIVISLLIFPNIFGIVGVWIAVPIAEFLSIAVGFYFYKRYKNSYGY